MRQQHPTLSVNDISQEISEMWRDLDLQTKAYEKKSVEAQELYQQQVALFETARIKMLKAKLRLTSHLLPTNPDENNGSG